MHEVSRATYYQHLSPAAGGKVQQAQNAGVGTSQAGSLGEGPPSSGEAASGGLLEVCLILSIHEITLNPMLGCFQGSVASAGAPSPLIQLIEDSLVPDPNPVHSDAPLISHPLASGASGGQDELGLGDGESGPVAQVEPEDAPTLGGADPAPMDGVVGDGLPTAKHEFGSAFSHCKAYGALFSIQLSISRPPWSPSVTSAVRRLGMRYSPRNFESRFSSP
jgi:hypothetical protein